MFVWFRVFLPRIYLLLRTLLWISVFRGYALMLREEIRTLYSEYVLLQFDFCCSEKVRFFRVMLQNIVFSMNLLWTKLLCLTFCCSECTKIALKSTLKRTIALFCPKFTLNWPWFHAIHLIQRSWYYCSEKVIQNKIQVTFRCSVGFVYDEWRCPNWKGAFASTPAHAGAPRWHLRFIAQLTIGR